MTTIAFTGNITSPLELRFTQGGKAVGSVTVAVNRKRGEVEETDFHRVTLWESLAENAAQLDKGTRVEKSMLYSGQTGTLTTNSGDPDDFWDWNVVLDSGRRIGVNDFQVVAVVGSTPEGQTP